MIFGGYITLSCRRRYNSIIIGNSLSGKCSYKQFINSVFIVYLVNDQSWRTCCFLNQKSLFVDVNARNVIKVDITHCKMYRGFLND